MTTVLTCLADATRNQFCPGFDNGSVEEDNLQQVVELYTRYGREQYRMTVQKMDGIRHGEAQLEDSNEIVRFRFTYDRGQLTGPCHCYRANGTLEMKMELRNNILTDTIIRCDENGEPLPENVQDIINEQPEDPYLRDGEGRIIGERRRWNIVWQAKIYDNETKMKIRDGNDNILYDGEFTLDEQQKVIKHGKGVEYQKGHPYYVGEFVNDKRRYEYTPCEDQTFRGYYEEKTADGTLTSICQLKKNTRIKHGWSIEFSEETKEPTGKKKYEDGKEVNTQVEVNGNEMVEYDKMGKKIYRGEFVYMNGKFIRWGKGVEYEDKEREKYEGEFVNGYYHGQGNFFDNGQLHFNGSWQHGYPQGHGMLTGEVHMEGNWNMGYCGVVDYERGRKRGLFERAGSKLYNPREKEVKKRRKEGEDVKKEWGSYVNQQLWYSLRLTNESADQINRIDLPEKSMNMYPRIADDVPLNLGQFGKIETLRIGPNCCEYVSQFILKDLHQLKSIYIAANSFSRNTDGRNIKGSFCISNCPSLNVLSIEAGCFKEFECFTLSELDSLQTLVLNNIGFEGRKLCLKSMLR